MYLSEPQLQAVAELISVATAALIVIAIWLNKDSKKKIRNLAPRRKIDDKDRDK